MSRSGPIARKPPVVRAAATVPARAKPKAPGRVRMPAWLADMVLERAEWCCDRCGRSLHEIGYSRQHRRAFGAGGRADGMELHTPANVVAACGSATSPRGCHNLMENEGRGQCELEGWVIRGEAQDPASVPVLHWRHGLVIPGDGVWLPAGREGDTPDLDFSIDQR